MKTFDIARKMSLLSRSLNSVSTIALREFSASTALGSSVKQLTIIGSGLMGAGIAQVNELFHFSSSQCNTFVLVLVSILKKSNIRPQQQTTVFITECRLSIRISECPKYH